jgi:predicted deacylase
VKKNEKLGRIEDAFGSESVSLSSPGAGVIIGHTINPLVHQGDAVLHIGLVE